MKRNDNLTVNTLTGNGDTPSKYGEKLQPHTFRDLGNARGSRGGAEGTGGDERQHHFRDGVRDPGSRRHGERDVAEGSMDSSYESRKEQRQFHIHVGSRVRGILRGRGKVRFR